MRSNPDFTFVIKMKLFNSGEAIHAENALLANINCPQCKSVSWKKICQTIIESSDIEEDCFPIHGDRIDLECDNCQRNIAVDFLFAKTV